MASHRPRLWLPAAIVVDGIILARLVARGFGILPVSDEGPILELAAFGVLAIYVAVAVWLWRNPSRRAWAAAMGLYILGVHVAGCWISLLVLGLGMSSAPLEPDELALAGRAFGFLFAQIALAVATYWAARRADVESPFALLRSGVKAMYVGGFVVIVLALFLGMAVGSIGKSDSPEQFDRVRAAVHRVQGCAAQYAETDSAGGYPATLAAMGPAGSRCLDAATARGEANDVLVDYQPDTEGGPSVVRYTVRARSKPSFRYRTDEVEGYDTGLAYAPNLFYGGSLGAVAQARGCLELHREMFPGAPFPESFAELARAVETRARAASHPAEQRGCALSFVPSALSPASRDGAIVETLEGHRMTYRPDGRDDYELEARPLKYGETAVLSYLVRHGGGVHFTLLDRPATDDDPDVPPCEYRDSPKHVYEICVAMPGVPPEVEFLHDSVVSRDSDYVLSGRDARDPATASRAGALRFHIECDARKQARLSDEPSEESERSCDALSRTSAPQSERIVVRLRAMDRSGALTIVEDTIRVAP